MTDKFGGQSSALFICSLSISNCFINYIFQTCCSSLERYLETCKVKITNTGKTGKFGWLLWGFFCGFANKNDERALHWRAGKLDPSTRAHLSIWKNIEVWTEDVITCPLLAGSSETHVNARRELALTHFVVYTEFLRTSPWKQSNYKSSESPGKEKETLIFFIPSLVPETNTFIRKDQNKIN